MADILFLRGAPAFSVFRLQGLQQRLQDVVPGARIAGAEYWHFAKLKRELAPEARAQLAAPPAQTLPTSSTKPLSAPCA